MGKEFRLTHDPVFQVNACIWLVRKMPTAPRGPRPALAAHGFVLRALGQKLGMAPSLRQKLLSLKLKPDPPEPDVLFYQLPAGHHLVIECKAHSFSTDSSTAIQARKLLAVCADPVAAVGAAQDAEAEAIVVYALPSEDAELQQATLTELSHALAEDGLPVARSGTLGLSIESGGLWAELNLLKVDSPFEDICRKLWVTDGDDRDARPLYFIPYDPAAADNQCAEERNYCSRQLTERILTYTMMVVGRADIPDSVHVSANDALKYSTFDISERWKAKELTSLRRRIAQEIGLALNRGELHGKVRTTNSHVEVGIASLDEQQVALSLLHKAQVEHMANQLMTDQIQLDEER